MIPLVAEFAFHYNVTNDFRPPDFGIDTSVALVNFMNLLLYPLVGSLTDKFGILVMVVGSWCLSISTFWWYLSSTNFTSVLLSRILSSVADVAVVSALLRISAKWFPTRERPVAVAFGALARLLGAGSSLIIAPLFRTDELFINTELKSCLASFSKVNNETLADEVLCSDLALEKFCCSAPVNIDGYGSMTLFLQLTLLFRLNLTMFILSVLATVCSIDYSVRFWLCV